MRYSVEFEMQSDLGDTAVSEAVYGTIVSAFGSINNFKVVQGSAYVGYFKGNQPIIWSEVRPNRPS
jgi:hypothetical protein